jgi:hypothetical protein
MAIIAVAYSFQLPNNVGTHIWERGVSISACGRRVPGPIVLLSVLMAEHFMAVIRHQAVLFAYFVEIQFQFDKKISNKRMEMLHR